MLIQNIYIHIVHLFPICLDLIHNYFHLDNNTMFQCVNYNTNEMDHITIHHYHYHKTKNIHHRNIYHHYF